MSHQPISRGQSAGLVPPDTPRKDGTEFSELIRSLEEQWQLGLRVRDEKHWSPHKSANQLCDKVYGQLKRYYYGGEFYEVIERFSMHAKAPSKWDTEAVKIARLTLLHETIKEFGRVPSGTPGSGVRRGLSAGLHLLKTDQPCEFELLVWSG